jgi:hypothetical protein
MGGALNDLLLFSWSAALVTGILIRAATLLISAVYSVLSLWRYGRVKRAVAALAIAALTGGCFQPLSAGSCATNSAPWMSYRSRR